MVVQFNFPTPIRFGLGAIDELADSLVPHKKPLLVTDRNIAKLGFVTKILDQMSKAGLDVKVFSDIEGNPVESDVTKGVESYKGHGADCLVLLGGGATLDVGKAIALLASHPGSLFDYEDGNPNALPTPHDFPFMVAIPTTSGTGSEVGRSSVISDDKTKAKKIIFSPKMLPNLVIADPKLTEGLPPAITAATGVDALTHLIEAYLAKGFHPMCDGIALEGIRLVSKSLKKAVDNGSDLEARADMLAASMMGAVAFQKGLGVNHSCAHALSTVFDTHHGLANALMLPACMEFNQEAVPDRFTTMARTIGLEKGEDFVPWLRKLNASIGIDGGLKGQGVDVTEALLDVAEADICHPLGPRPVSREDFRKLYQKSM